MLNLLCWIFKYLNIFILAKHFLKFLIELIPFLINKNNKHNFLKKYGENSYVLITGSSEGIGYSYAEVFAKLGFNIILIGRNLEKLENAKNNIIKILKKKVDIKCIEIEFKCFEKKENLKSFLEKLEEFDISILINNVAISNNKSDFEKNKNDFLINMNNINCFAMAYLIKEFILRFKKRKKRNCIINLSSIASKIIANYASTYSPCKLFNLYISKSLYKWKKNENKIDFLLVKPGLVLTQTAKNFVTDWEKIKFLACSANQCVEGSLLNLGFLSECNGSLIHVILSNILNFILFYLEFFGIFKLIQILIIKISK